MMTPSSSNIPVEDTPVLELIKRIKNKQLQPKTIGPEDRRRCVEVLRSEGYTLAEIGQILSVSERTIQRDIEKLRQEHALAPDPQLPERMIGELVQQAEVSIARLRRIAREASASAMERLMAESLAWKVGKELFEKLQSAGYVPRVPHSVVTDVYQHLEVNPVAGYEQLAAQLQEMEQLCDGPDGVDSARSVQCRQLLDEVNRGRLSASVDQLEHQSPDGGEAGHEGN